MEVNVTVPTVQDMKQPYAHIPAFNTSASERACELFASVNFYFSTARNIGLELPLTFCVHHETGTALGSEPLNIIDICLTPAFRF